MSSERSATPWAATASLSSLDLQNGEPIIASLSRTDKTGTSEGILAGEPAHRRAARAADAGVRTMIVIDLARVGTRKGLDLGLIARVRAATPGLTLVAGGGVRGPEDLTQLAAAGCDGALVATSLHRRPAGRRGNSGRAELLSAEE